MIDIRIQRQRNLLIAVYFYIREAFIAWGGQLFLVEHRCAADLRARKTSGACRSNLQQATHRRGHNDVVAHCIRHCYRAAGYDDRTLNVHVIQLYRIRGQTFGQVQIAVDRRIGEYLHKAHAAAGLDVNTLHVLFHMLRHIAVRVRIRHGHIRKVDGLFVHEHTGIRL